MNSYYDRRMERVPTLKEELAQVMTKYKGHVIGTTACIGGELGTAILNLTACEDIEDDINAQRYHNQIVDFMEFCISIFGKDDFYIEVAPAASPEQIIVNKRLYSIAQAFGVQMSIGNDAHYLRKEDRYIHKAYLNSKGGEREVDIFYEFCYLKLLILYLLHRIVLKIKLSFILQSSIKRCQKLRLLTMLKVLFQQIGLIIILNWLD